MKFRKSKQDIVKEKELQDEVEDRLKAVEKRLSRLRALEIQALVVSRNVGKTY